jgi:hypothetical protein
MSGGSTKKDPAKLLLPGGTLDTVPFGVRTLTEVAELLTVELHEVERASQHVQPWLHDDGQTTFWSVRQIARVIVRDRARPNRGGRGRELFRTRAQAEQMATYLAEHGPRATVQKYSCHRSTLYKTLERFQLPPPVGKGGPGIPRPKKVA